MADLYTVTALDSAVYTNTANWEGGSAPAADDDVTFRFDNSTALAGSDQSAVELDDIEVLPACTGDAGSENAYLQLANKTIFSGRGTWYLDLGTSGSAEVRVTQTKSASNGSSALYFRNNTNAITLFVVESGNVRITAPSTITSLVVKANATVYIEEGATVATIYNEGGTIIDGGASVTTWEQRLGTTTRNGSDTASVNMYGGVFYNDSTGALTAVCYGGLLDAARDNRGKSVTLTLNGGTAIIGPNVTLSDTLNSVTTMTA